MRRWWIALIVAGLITAGPAVAQLYGRAVVVNGSLVGPQELAILDSLNGEPVPNGRYWLDTITGEWGYEGGPAQGILGGADYGGSGGGSPGTGGGGTFEDTVTDWCVRNGISCNN